MPMHQSDPAARGEDLARVTIYTTAPEAYDHGLARELEVLGEAVDGADVRAVSVPETAAEWQQGRYSSGLHLATTSRETAEAALR